MSKRLRRNQSGTGKLERRAIQWGLGILLVLATADAFGDFLPKQWQTPGIFLALVLLIRLVEPVEIIHENVKLIKDATTAIPVKRLENPDKFFQYLNAAMRDASRTLDATHIRDEPPREFGKNAAEYYHDIETWLGEDESRSVRRVISICNERMYVWATSLAAVSERQPRFRVRVVDWATKAPAINFALVDKAAVFLALSGESALLTSGLAVEDEKAGQYFADYFENLWNQGESLDRFLQLDKELFVVENPAPVNTKDPK